MPSWGEIGAEILQQAQQPSGAGDPRDIVRRKYLAALHAYTGNAVVLYATRWTMPANGVQGSPFSTSITFGDIHAFMEALYGVTESNLDLIIHSPGGSPEAAQATVKYLRSKFSHIRVFVPHMAMSAATMIACAADEIIMGKHSFIGPIDPQIQLQTPLGARLVPAQAIVDQFEQAVSECQDLSKQRAWIPMLTMYGPELLVTCNNAIKLSQELVSAWLENYMFKGNKDATSKANGIAKWLGDHNTFKTHGHPISQDEARKNGLNVKNLECDKKLQDLVLSIYHAAAHTFAQVPVCTKVVENHRGKTFMENVMPPMAPFSLIPLPVVPKGSA
jgi:hypothetical protein